MPSMEGVTVNRAFLFDSIGSARDLTENALQTDALGDIQGSEDGLFTDDTRMLSRYELCIGDQRPSLLGAAINQRSTLFTAI